MIEYLFRGKISTEIETLTRPKKGCWIQASNLTQKDFRILEEELGFSRKKIFESLDLFEIPRIELSDDKVFIYLRTPGDLDETGRIISDTILLVVSGEHVVTVSAKKNTFIERVRNNQELVTSRRTKFVFELLHSLVQEYSSAMLSIHHKVQHQFAMGKEVTPADIKKLLEYEQLANLYQAALVPLTHVTDQLSLGNNLPIFVEDAELLAEVRAEAEQALDIVNVTSKFILSLRDSYQIIFTNTLNNNVQFLAAITIVLTIPTITASLFGMNVPVPLAEHTLAFPIILSGSIITAILLFAFLRFKKWI